MFPLFIFYYSSFLRALADTYGSRGRYWGWLLLPVSWLPAFSILQAFTWESETGESDLPWLTSTVVFTIINIRIRASPCIPPSHPAISLPCPPRLPPVPSAGARSVPRDTLLRLRLPLPPVWNTSRVPTLQEWAFILHGRSLHRAGAEQFCLASSCIINKKRILTNNLPKNCSLE